jgi:hypothetical protein
VGKAAKVTQPKKNRGGVGVTFAEKILMHYMALQALRGTSDNSSILAYQCLECCETFVATDDLRAPIQNQQTSWLDNWKKKMVMLPYRKLNKMLSGYRSTANMIRSQMSIGQTIANEKNEAFALCIFTRA